VSEPHLTLPSVILSRAQDPLDRSLVAFPIGSFASQDDGKG